MVASISSAQRQRMQWLQQQNEQELAAKEDAMKQAAQAWQQYRPKYARPNTKDILENWWQTLKQKQQRLSDIYQEMYNITNNRPDLLQNVWEIYKSVWYDTMSNQQKEIVDYFLGGK